MENTMDKIGEFLNEKGIEFKASGSTVYSYFAPFEETARLKGSTVQIITENGKIRICVELPFRIRRKEYYTIACIIAKVNSNLPEFCGYTLDPISGLLHFVGQHNIPNDAEMLGEMLDSITKCVEEDIDMFFDAIYDAEKAGRMEDEDCEEDCLDEDSEYISIKSKSPSLLESIFDFIGLSNTKEKN